MKQMKDFFRGLIVIFVTLLSLIAKSIVKHPFASMSLILLLILYSASSKIVKLNEEIYNMKVEKYMMDNRIDRLIEDSVILHRRHETDTVYAVRVKYVYIEKL